MLTKEQIIEAVKSGREGAPLDNRDYKRLIQFFEPKDWAVFGFTPKEDADKTFTPKEFTRENVLEQLKSDVEFGFQKALDRRGISAGLMHCVVAMWMWVLEDMELSAMFESDDKYPMYGLPCFKAVAVKYGFPNPIGEDVGDERQYCDEDE